MGVWAYGSGQMRCSHCWCSPVRMYTFVSGVDFLNVVLLLHVIPYGIAVYSTDLTYLVILDIFSNIGWQAMKTYQISNDGLINKLLCAFNWNMFLLCSTFISAKAICDCNARGNHIMKLWGLQSVSVCKACWQFCRSLNFDMTVILRSDNWRRKTLGSWLSAQ